MKNMHFTHILFAVFCITLMGGSAMAQKQSNNLFLIVNDDGNLYGFMNSKGTIIVKPQYVNANEFSEGMAAVAVQDDDYNFNWGFVNHTGKLVIPAIYTEVSNFSDGVAFAKLDGKWLLIDKNGKTVAKCNELDDYSYISVSDFHEGMAVFMVDEKYGYVNKQGKIAIRPSFEFAKDFKDGLAGAVVMTEKEDVTIYRIGYIDKSGNFVWSYTQQEEKNNDYYYDDNYYDTVSALEIDDSEEIIEEISLDEDENEDEDSRIFVVVEQDPEFPGGMEALYRYLSENLQYPQLAKDNGISGMVYVTFVIEKDGSVSNPKILREIGGGCGAEAIRVVKAMPKWIPGKQRGKPVRVQFTLPVKFQFNDDTETE